MIGLTGKNFKVEIRNNCKICGKEITIKRYRTFCSAKCRNRSNNQKHKVENAKYQRERQDRIASEEAPGKIQCQLCGRWYRQVSNHVFLRHGITAREYKRYLGLDVKKGILPEDLKLIKKIYVFDNGTVENLKAGRVNWFKKNDPRAGRYQRSEQTLERLKNLHKLNKNYDV